MQVQAVQAVKSEFLEILFILQLFLIGIAGGIVHYLIEYLRNEDNSAKISTILMFANGFIGLFSGYMSFLFVSLFWQSDVVFFLAMGIGSFSGEGALRFILKMAKMRIEFVDIEESVKGWKKDGKNGDKEKNKQDG